MSEKPDGLENGSLLMAQVDPPDADGPPTSDVGAPARVPRWRRVVVALLVVLGCVLAPLSVLSIWLKTTLLDTSSYVATMAPLAEDPDVLDPTLARTFVGRIVFAAAALALGYAAWLRFGPGAAPGFTARARAATSRPRRSAVCIGTEIAMTRARASFWASSGSTETSISAGR